MKEILSVFLTFISINLIHIADLYIKIDKKENINRFTKIFAILNLINTISMFIVIILK